MKKLENIVNEAMKKEALDTIKGGYSLPRMATQLDYGCDSNICASALNEKYCNYKDSEICKSCVCTSGVGPSV
jgi:hypothetical protein